MQAIRQQNIGVQLPESESVPFIERPSKGSKNLSKAQAFEKEISLILHQRYHPVLISPLLLRSFGCGQVDISFIQDKCLVIGELKSGKSLLSQIQKHRLKKTQQLLSLILDVDTRMLLINELPKF